ncbi:MAG: purine-binding chemotaxis protein CheW [Kofleriaceae bacterium]|nr:purine-binding chemotaxis protein CheW [Kofleriaceae bacterium]MBP9204754.1 purine-binding chemotaxis protein CheW [Kofleriaceae bacterium]
MSRYCTFFVAGHLLGLEATRVVEVVPLREVTPVVGAGAHVRGLINLRGRIVTCLDLAELLRFPARGTPAIAMVVEDHGSVTALAVDAMDDVLEIADETLEPAPSNVDPARARQLVGTARLPTRLLLILDVQRVLDDSTPVQEV